jgi:hypothetical protein
MLDAMKNSAENDEHEPSPDFVLPISDWAVVGHVNLSSNRNDSGLSQHHPDLDAPNDSTTVRVPQVVAHLDLLVTDLVTVLSIESLGGVPLLVPR